MSGSLALAKNSLTYGSNCRRQTAHLRPPKHRLAAAKTILHGTEQTRSLAIRVEITFGVVMVM